MRSTANPLGDAGVLGMPPSTCCPPSRRVHSRRGSRAPNDGRGAGGIERDRRRHRGGHAVTAQPQAPLVAGAAVILTGEWLEAALQAVLIAARARARNGLPNSGSHLALAQALNAAMSASGHSVVRVIEDWQHYPQQEPPT